jgi:hypothetical protein
LTAPSRPEVRDQRVAQLPQTDCGQVEVRIDDDATGPLGHEREDVLDRLGGHHAKGMQRQWNQAGDLDMDIEKQMRVTSGRADALLVS